MIEPPPVFRPQVNETHVSYVFLVGDRAYKLKKPIRTAFLDFSTEPLRHRACHREVELNRRLAPDVYLGVDTIVDERGRPVDHLVEMRRMRDEQRLSRLLTSGANVDDELTQVAHQLAIFHGRALTSPDIARAGSPEMVRWLWDENLQELTPFRGNLLPDAAIGRVQELAIRYLQGRTSLLRTRMAGGLGRDGHGDLLADDIFFTPDGPRILDCLEFDDHLRYGDVLLDLAFLAMDLEYLGHPREASWFLSRYRELSGWVWPSSLEDHYVAYRALVRSKVACLRDQEGMPSGREARDLLDLCLRRLRHGRVRLVLVGGEPGTGKSTLSRRLGEREEFAVFRSDEVRKDLAGVEHTASLRDAAEVWYGPDATAATYGELLRRARPALEHGLSVILDASWSDPARRREALELGRQTVADVLQLRCQVEPAVADARLRARVGDASDADPEVGRRMRRSFADWPQAHVLTTASPIEESVGTAQRLLAADSS